MSQPQQSLFDALGGQQGVAQAVDEMYRRVLADDQLAHFFANADLVRLRRMQTEFFSAMVDGPVRYSGAELQEIHRGRGIEQRHFSRFCSHLVDALNERGVANHLVDQVLGRLAMYSDKITGTANIDG